jgi:hypothetical protein
MQLEIEESALAHALSVLGTEEQQQFFATMKALLGLPLNLRETQGVCRLTARLTQRGDEELVGILESRMATAMQLGGQRE